MDDQGNVAVDTKPVPMNEAEYAYPNPQYFEDDNFLAQLTPTQEHFLKKYLLENQLSSELHELTDPNCCESLGEPFDVNPDTLLKSLPLLRFFFKNFLTTFPFITNNSKIDQLIFWKDTVQPFVKSFNLKNISSSEDRKENITKRRQVNKKFLSGLLLFYNSVIVTEKDLVYLDEAHLKPSDTGKLDKIQGKQKDVPVVLHGLEEYEFMSYYNDVSINVVAVRKTKAAPVVESWNPLRRYYETPAPRHNYEFVIQVTRREGVDEKYIYTSHFVSHHYQEFKNLAASLKKLFPGLMSTEGPHLPSKASHDEGTNEIYLDSVSDESLRSVTSQSSNSKLSREKLRLALRGYLLSLLKFPEIAHSPPFGAFLSKNSFEELTPDDYEDHQSRLAHEKNMLDTQGEFQRQTTQVMMQLSKDFDNFKEQLIMNPQTIVEIFREIGVTPNIDDLSPLLRTFNEWNKLEVAATLYQVFLGQDNSYEWFVKCKKFHRLFPYNVVYGILRFTNPVKIVSRVVDLLLVNLPSLPSWSSEQTGTRNLLSMIFIMLLDEDLNDFEKELKELREKKVDSSFSTFISRIDLYVQLGNEDVAEIHHQAIEQNKDLLLTILSTEIIDSPFLQDKYSDIVASYEAYEKIESEKDLGGSEIYLNLKQYWQVLVRKKDKDLTKQLWQEPELTKLIKNFLTIFYQPLMKLLGKSDVHIVFKDFQKFMDDLINELTILNNEDVYVLSSIEIFNRLKKILDKHDSTMWNFIHNIYKKDDQQLFMKLIEWIQNFLFLIRLKLVDSKQVTLDISNYSGVHKLDKELFLNQLNSKLNKVVLKRKLYKEYLEERSKMDISSQGRIDENWKKMNDNVFSGMNMNGLGVDDDDIQEFNILHGEDDVGPGSNLDKKLKKDLFELENGNNYGTSELDKLDCYTHKQLVSMLENVNLLKLIIA